ncbi:MAG: type I-B CRISPR-associated protein Cas5b [Candidatus Altiarchaeia archaeon]
MNKILIFDVWGDYAHFRRYYTTTSPLTFPIPPRTALCGLIGAIIGLEKENNKYLEDLTLDKAFIGLQISPTNPIKKVVLSENLIHTKNAKGPGMNLIDNRTQILFEFLKNPKYRIYFYHVGDLYNQLKENVEQHKSVYTPCLGLSEHIANFELIEEAKVSSLTQKEYVKISSVIPIKKTAENEGILFASEGEYFSTRIPVEMNCDRIVTKYSDVIFERCGNPIDAKLIESYIKVDYKDGTRENILFIE